MVATASAAAAVLGPADVLKRVKDAFETLSPEVRRAARWLSDHSTEVALLSMRHQARSAGVSPPTMIRLARALGFADYASLRRPFQEAITGGRVRFGRRASALQSAPAATRIARLMREIVDAQVDDLRSVQTLNSPAQIESAVKAIARARRVGFLGVRASFSIAYNFRYAYNLIATNGVLFDWSRSARRRTRRRRSRRSTRRNAAVWRPSRSPTAPSRRSRAALRTRCCFAPSRCRSFRR
jgi:DNA-binding MurR/RpiR family transcriptional regulator